MEPAVSHDDDDEDCAPSLFDSSGSDSSPGGSDNPDSDSSSGPSDHEGGLFAYAKWLETKQRKKTLRQKTNSNVFLLGGMDGGRRRTEVPPGGGGSSSSSSGQPQQRRAAEGATTRAPKRVRAGADILDSFAEIESGDEAEGERGAREGVGLGSGGALPSNAPGPKIPVICRNVQNISL